MTIPKVEELEKKEATNWTDIKRYNPKLGACGYVGKYIFKNNATYDLLI